MCCALRHVPRIRPGVFRRVKFQCCRPLKQLKRSFPSSSFYVYRKLRPRGKSVACSIFCGGGSSKSSRPRASPLFSLFFFLSGARPHVTDATYIHEKSLRRDKTIYSGRERQTRRDVQNEMAEIRTGGRKEGKRKSWQDTSPIRSACLISRLEVAEFRSRIQYTRERKMERWWWWCFLGRRK